MAFTKATSRANGGRTSLTQRYGAIVPLFAIVLPALIVLSAVALNITYSRLLSTELKIATDATAHAAGRAFSVYQNVDQTIAFAKQIAARNSIGNKPFRLQDSQIVFGRSTRPGSGGRYNFSAFSTADARNGVVSPNSIAINASATFPMLLSAIGNHTSLLLREKSIATQADRDIVLVLDKSGSMLTYKDDTTLNNALYNLYRLGQITRSEYNNAKDSDIFSLNVATRLSGDMKQFAQDKRASSSVAPRHCRWYQLRLGVDAFFQVVEGTDQAEQVAVVTFSSGATLNNVLSTNYTPHKATINSIYPSGNTAIGLGMQTAAPELFTSTRARPYASKTIVVLTDGVNNVAPDPRTVAQNLVSQYKVTIHTVTFSDGADITAMQQVAATGGGKHFHSNDGSELTTIFRTIANNLPTLLTE
jgi:Mg-chelatase subunit ChlD